MPNTRTGPRKTARRVSHARHDARPKSALRDRGDLRLALADRILRVADMLRFQAQAIIEVRFVRRVLLPVGREYGVRAERLEEGLEKVASDLRSLAATITDLGVDLDSLRSDGPNLPPALIAGTYVGQVPTLLADTYLERAAMAASECSGAGGTL